MTAGRDNCSSHGKAFCALPSVGIISIHHWLVTFVCIVLVSSLCCYQVHGSESILVAHAMASSSSSQEIPTWSGDPVEFETFAIACRWYEKSVKESERKQSASRVWAKLTGPAKAVVRHLNPDDFETADGLTKLVEILRTSPLQQLPVPDLFKRLDAWHYIRRNAGESIPQLLVREEDQFTQLLSALARAREDRQGRSDASRSPEAVTPAVSAFQSPTTGGLGRGGQGTGAGLSQAAAAGAAAGTTSAAVNLMKDFFEDELRGYRLLKSANLTSHER